MRNNSKEQFYAFSSVEKKQSGTNHGYVRKVLLIFFFDDFGLVPLVYGVCFVEIDFKSLFSHSFRTFSERLTRQVIFDWYASLAGSDLVHIFPFLLLILSSIFKVRNFYRNPFSRHLSGSNSSFWTMNDNYDEIISLKYFVSGKPGKKTSTTLVERLWKFCNFSYVTKLFWMIFCGPYYTFLALKNLSAAVISFKFFQRVV